MTSFWQMKSVHSALAMTFSILTFVSLISTSLSAQKNNGLSEIDNALQDAMSESKSDSADSSTKDAEKSGQTKVQNKEPKPSLEADDLLQERFRSEQEDGPSAFWLFIKVVFVFGGLLIGMLFILRFLSKNRESRYPVKGMMSVLSSLPLAQNRDLQLVEVSGRYLLLGVAEGGINLITELTSPEDRIKIEKMKSDFTPMDFTFLDSFLNNIKETYKGRRKNPSDELEQQGKDKALDFQGLQSNRLKKWKDKRESLEDGENGIFQGGSA